MKYPYIVNHNGKWYPTGEEVPAGNDFVLDEKVVEKVKDNVIEITDDKIIKENQFTKTDINRMSTAELKELASKEDVDGAEDMTGSELKKVLIEKFGL